jgi:EEF1A lysine methyltransferase 4
MGIYEMIRDEELAELGFPEYWNKKYAQERIVPKDSTQPTIKSYEWYRNFEALRPLLKKHLPAPSDGCHILHLGCGRSVALTFHFVGALED